MKKFAIVVFAALLAVSCLKKNDLTNYAVQANIVHFAIEGQLTCTIDSRAQKVSVLMPARTDLSTLKLTAFSVTEGATCEPELSVGEILDLQEPMCILLSNEDVYSWTIEAASKEPRAGAQLYNMNFDSWTEVLNDKKSVWYAYGADATDEQKAVWGNANKSITDMGKDSNCLPESEFVAVKGEGKKALKLVTNLLDFWILKKLAAGSIFTGRLGEINFSTFNADLYWGIPFSDRPYALDGYGCYKPATINEAMDPYKDLLGQMDNGHVIVVLADWNEPYKVNAPATLIDYENDPAIIGYGKMVFDHEMSEYEHFTLEIEYRNERTPKYLVIVASSSAWGDYFTGADGSTLYLDEFSFLYK